MSKSRVDAPLARRRRTISVGTQTSSSKLRRVFRENGLSIVLFGLFLAFLSGQAINGYYEHNEDLREHGESVIAFLKYVRSDHFLEATGENWESEFLQIFAYVLFAACLYQKGSAESRDPYEPEETVKRPNRNLKNVPWPVRKGGLFLKLYKNSLSLVFLLLFAGAFWLHVVASAALHNQEQAQHGANPVSVVQYLGTARFWFESFQNWQSEFLAIGAMAVLSIFLRQKGRNPSTNPIVRQAATSARAVLKLRITSVFNSGG